MSLNSDIRKLNTGTIEIVNGVVDAKGDIEAAKTLTTAEKELLNRGLTRGAVQLRVKVTNVVGTPAFTLDNLKAIFGETVQGDGMTLTDYTVAGAEIAFTPEIMTLSCLLCDKLQLAATVTTLDAENYCTLLVALDIVE